MNRTFFWPTNHFLPLTSNLWIPKTKIWFVHMLQMFCSHFLKNLFFHAFHKHTFPQSTLVGSFLITLMADFFEKPRNGSQIVKSENPTHCVQAALPNFLKIWRIVCCCKLWTKMSKLLIYTLLFGNCDFHLKSCIAMKTKQCCGWNLLYGTPNAKWQKKCVKDLHFVIFL